MCHNVLIIAPSREVQKVLSDKISVAYQLFTAIDHPAILTVLKEHPIDLVICLAVDRPATGYFCCRQLKSDNISAHIPFILITREESLQIHIKALEAGADVHIGGPVFRECLDAHMRNLITNRGKIRQHFQKRAAGEDQVPEQDGKGQIMRQLTSCVLSLQSPEGISVDQLARMMHMSRPTLYRKIKDITHLTPNELINEARLRKAAELLAEGEYKVLEVARMVGYGSPSSFGKSFLKQFKVTPATYQRMKKIMDAA
ncbi:AraC family transcriptional regulator [Paraflavitalea soli]|uniref:AraC family transcriptional regulator n=1 Tax=Paraflavitalea soli TaxID=2315862 RepID=A0A3B7MR82_9BACT|nr:helix-turn-helix domain-containing protein [Paraflavitalea soli]AXY74115.1 AraC family transcriptional regulator [Paraflavitalea soli]